MTGFHIVIPARYGSGRLPGKPLLDIAGKSMIQRVVETAGCSGASSVTVATDDERICSVVEAFGGNAMMTSLTHRTGSDRIAEACGLLGFQDSEMVVNLQGDEPMMPPELIDQVARLLASHPQAHMATLSTPLENQEQFLDPALVKVVTNHLGMALYFSRAPIPWMRAESSSDLAAQGYSLAQRHLGIYAYTSGYIREFAARNPCDLEKIERLEQLRTLWQGESIACAEAVIVPPAGVDNQQDLDRVRRLYAAGAE
ncbi:MAG: 3-deoxy-manno-octulosonate cytidylyltransferase [bacterium]